MVIYYCPLQARRHSRPTRRRPIRSGAASAPAWRTTPSTATPSTSTTTASLYVNLFIPSELTWTDKGLTIRQATSVPERGHDVAYVSALDSPVRLGDEAASPAGRRSGMTVAVNGQPASRRRPSPAAMSTVDREWKSGDTVTVRMPMTPAPGVAAGRPAHPGAAVRPGRARRRPGHDGPRRGQAIRPERAADWSRRRPFRCLRSSRATRIE